jgi:protein-disulfide isomerase
MASGKKSRERKRAAAAAPPPVQSKGAPRSRQASPRVLAIGAGVVALVAIAIVLAIVLTGGKDSTPTITQTTGSAATGLPGAAEAETMYKRIPQTGLKLGSPKAPVRMVMYIDLQCPVCQNYETTVMPTIVSRYIRPGKVQLEIKPWAFIGTDSTRGQKAMLAAAEQNKAFQFAQVLYDNQGTENTGWLTDDMLISVAGSVTGMDVPRLMSDRNSSTVEQQVKDVAAAAAADHVAGTPTVFVGQSGAKPSRVGAADSVPDLSQTEAALDVALAG